MNKVYRLVWSAVTGAWVCVAETARARGKTRGTAVLRAGLLPLFLLGSSGWAWAGAPAPNTLPQGGQVVAGQASIQQNAPASLTIQQGTQRAAIDWQSFNIGAAASVKFIQPSNQSVTLNRVLDGNPTQIFGKLTANYNVTYLDNTNSTITPKALTISGITASNKVYDATTAATLSTAGIAYTGLVSGDVVTDSVTGTFANKNVGTAKTVTLANVIGGADAGNYTITNQATTTADITPKTLTVSQLSVADRSYNGTATASVVTGSAQFTGLISGNSFGIASSSGTFANKNVGAGKTVTLSTSYNGSDASNYTVVDQASTTASITPALLSISTSNVSKTYDGTTNVSGGMAVVSSGTLFGSDSLSGGTFAYTDKNAGVGTKVVNVSGVTVSDGNSGGNYTVNYLISFVDGRLTITPPNNILPPLLGASAGGSARASAVPGGTLGFAPAPAPTSGSRITVELTRLPDNTIDGFVSIKVPYDLATNGVGFNITLPSDVLGNEQDLSTAQLSLLDGRPLPAWMHFAAADHSLTASAVPDASFPMQMVLTGKGGRTVVVVTELPRP